MPDTAGTCPPWLFIHETTPPVGGQTCLVCPRSFGCSCPALMGRDGGLPTCSHPSSGSRFLHAILSTLIRSVATEGRAPQASGATRSLSRRAAIGLCLPVWARMYSCLRPRRAGSLKASTATGVSVPQPAPRRPSPGARGARRQRDRARQPRALTGQPPPRAARAPARPRTRNHRSEPSAVLGRRAGT